MQRAISIVLALAAVVLVTVITVKSAPRLPEPAMAVLDAGASGEAGADAASLAADAGAPGEALAAADPLSGLKGLEVAAAPVPAALGNGGPRQVRVGVILVEYDGAQGASSKMRSKRDALALATKLAAEAQTDFKGAVQQGDTGSSADIGSVQRGVLEPAPEAAVFALKPGEVSGVVDTPRGFWIVKRIE